MDLHQHAQNYAFHRQDVPESTKYSRKIYWSLLPYLFLLPFLVSAPRIYKNFSSPNLSAKLHLFFFCS